MEIDGDGLLSRVQTITPGRSFAAIRHLNKGNMRFVGPEPLRDITKTSMYFLIASPVSGEAMTVKHVAGHQC